MYTVSHRTSGRLKTSHGKAIGGGVWHHSGASRRLEEESGNGVVRTWLDGDVMLDALERGFVLRDEEDGIVDVMTVGWLE
jgi:hypothetical protein